MNEMVKMIAKLIGEEGRAERIKDMESLAQKCKKCMHYRWEDPNKVKWDHTFVPVTHVCDYSVLGNKPLRDLIIWGKVRDIKDATIGGSLNGFSHVYQSINGVRTIGRRVRLGECEFKEFPEPRSKPWGERDDHWDTKYKDKFVELLKPNLIKQGFEESEIPQIIAEEFGEE
jgi:hypothetical protein